MDLYRRNGKLSLRKIGVLVNYLPSESAVMTALRNSIPESERPEADDSEAVKAPWSKIEMLVATSVDEQRAFQHMWLQSKTGEPGTKPEPIARPGVKVKPKRPKMTRERAMRLDPRMHRNPEQGGA